ncbi:ptc2 protein [Uncinocarpus reesii 1704]|uniref:Ptc2 protein n=1 Tax=Uncinocarpus reesii (strain UAMH 1704) TaxID=336963 RepID=C4JTH3_UNCRE|nr:ptc2 protein [Uncinocarpus reesii 1704]EEP80920.1 ptc2 protein [Uncinocarpus reesii 1704]
MGQTLSEPVVEKISEEGCDECVIYGLSAMQGWRVSMEDAHSAVLDLQGAYLNKDNHATNPSKRMAFFGVFDGHGGEQMALYAGQNVSRIVAAQEAFARGDIEQALKDGFLATDRAVLEDPKHEEEVSGCTAAVAIVSNDKIRVANAGDSRSVLVKKQESALLVVSSTLAVNLGTAQSFSGRRRICPTWKSPRNKHSIRFAKTLMDNCLASNSETGGVGCDNMTMIIVGLLNGKTKEEWYNTIAERVAKGDGPCAPPEYAQLRGPGVRNQFDENPNEYDPALNSRAGTGRTGRIILLGDGTELLTDMGDEDEMFENGDTDSDEEPHTATTNSVEDPSRNEREGTPGPQNHVAQTNGANEGSKTAEVTLPSATRAEPPANATASQSSSS